FHGKPDEIARRDFRTARVDARAEQERASWLIRGERLLGRTTREAGLPSNDAFPTRQERLAYGVLNVIGLGERERAPVARRRRGDPAGARREDVRHGRVEGGGHRRRFLGTVFRALRAVGAVRCDAEGACRWRSLRRPTSPRRAGPASTARIHASRSRRSSGKQLSRYARSARRAAGSFQGFSTKAPSGSRGP